jgi:hypothetical protein
MFGTLALTHNYDTMKKLLFCSLVLLASVAQAQFKNILAKKSSDTSAKSTTLGSVLQKIPANKKSLTNEEIIAGLKEALTVGTDQATSKLSVADGFFKDAVIKILMPEEAKKVEQKLRSLGMGKQVDNAILAMNRAAEDAAKNAAPIFVKAVKEMSFTDAMGILRGNDDAATAYLKNRTTAALTEAFRPVIESSLQKTNATKYWNTLFTTYNKFSTDKVNTDLSAHVTEKALMGIFYQLANEEKKIRKDPMARTTEILKRVFGS